MKVSQRYASGFQSKGRHEEKKQDKGIWPLVWVWARPGHCAVPRATSGRTNDQHMNCELKPQTVINVHLVIHPDWTIKTVDWSSATSSLISCWFIQSCWLMSVIYVCFQSTWPPWTSWNSSEPYPAGKDGTHRHFSAVSKLWTEFNSFDL